MFILREALRGVRRMKGSWTMGVLTLAAMFGLGGFCGGLAYRAHRSLADLRAGLAIEAFLDPVASSEDVQAIAQQIQTMPEIASTHITSKEQALESYRKASGEDLERVLGLNPLPASIGVHLSDATPANAAKVENKLRAIAGVTEVRSDRELLSSMELRAHGLDTLSTIIGVLLLLAAIFYIVTYTGYHVTANRDALRTVHLLGATRNQMLMPLTIEAMLAGLTSGGFGATIMVLIQNVGKPLVPEGLQLFTQPRQYLFLYAATMAAGAVLALIFSTIAARIRFRSI